MLRASAKLNMLVRKTADPAARFFVRQFLTLQRVPLSQFQCLDMSRRGGSVGMARPVAGARDTYLCVSV